MMLVIIWCWSLYNVDHYVMDDGKDVGYWSPGSRCGRGEVWLTRAPTPEMDPLTRIWFGFCSLMACTIQNAKCKRIKSLTDKGTRPGGLGHYTWGLGIQLFVDKNLCLQMGFAVKLLIIGWYKPYPLSTATVCLSVQHRTCWTITNIGLCVDNIWYRNLCTLRSKIVSQDQKNGHLPTMVGLPSTSINLNPVIRLGRSASNFQLFEAMSYLD